MEAQWPCYNGVRLYHNRSPHLQWRTNGSNSVSNHQPHDCLLNRLFRRRSKITLKLRVTGLCAGNSPGPVNSPHKWPVTRKMFPFDDVIMHQMSADLSLTISAIASTDVHAIASIVCIDAVRPHMESRNYIHTDKSLHGHKYHISGLGCRYIYWLECLTFLRLTS